ncbi:right-handed parallel beta-helix repeat-containing protein [uncultured Methanobrevibacter sp.]|uniref:right-handed parallel beta-helix repeat-containing protein n=1 Tax=uncultured Methanobrevibacter sp. TaxID=253161 RepID=UPI0025E2CAD2|nr:right-handed parallel beta-helix repeat-containing protein [uncultured Methanobrevibacter sp.]
MIFAVVLSLSVVSAADNGVNNTLSDKDNVDIVKSNSNEILGDGEEATFTDLANDIESAESTLNLNKSYIYNSTNDSSILATGIKISKSIIINGNGHTIDAMGAKRIFEINASNVVLKNIIFTHGRHNTAGGAIYVQTDFKNITIENCSFIQNSALLRGGAIYTAGTVDINNCRFIENKLNGSSSNDRAAAAIYLYGNNSIISNSSFHLSHSGSEGYGGALYLYGSNTTIISCNFTNNTSTRWGGAINDRGAVKSYKIIDCNFIGNSAYYGGAAFNSNAGNTRDITCIVDKCYFDNNKLTGTADTDNGGVVRFVGSGALVNNSYFVSNSITSHGTILFQSSSSYNYVNNCTFLNNKALNGGAVYISGKYCNVTNCRVDNQSVSGTPHYGAGLYVSGQYNSVINCNFTNCSGNDHGATICWQGNYGSVINSIFINNRITVNARAGAAIRWTGNNGVITGSTFINNTATNYGGALSYTGSYMTLDNCTFIGNSATTYDGGAIHTENQASRTITNCIFINNKANRNAGAILLYGSSSTVNNCTFLSNTATSNGGAIYTTTAAKITSSLFKYNTAGIASVLYSSVANTNLSDSVILDNIATGSGQYTIYSSVANSIANNNWFGNTLNDKTTVIPKVYRTSLTNWYFLNMDATPTYSLTNVISNITVRLDQLSTSTGVVTLRGFEYSYPIDFNLTSDDGVLSINNVTLNKNNANLTFEIGDIGVYNLTAKHSGITAVKSVFHVPEDSISALNITLANATGVLNLTHNYKYYDEYDFEFISKCIDINKTIYINGNGFTIDGKNKIRLMNITADNVTIANLTFVNGSAFKIFYI